MAMGRTHWTLDEADMDIKQIKESLRQPFYSVQLDGRNEHGSHVLPLPGDSMTEHEKLEADISNQDLNLAEEIISDAEKLGFKVGQAVVTRWKQINDVGEPGGEYWDYMGVDPVLTELMWGTPEQQEAEHVKAACSQ